LVAESEVRWLQDQEDLERAEQLSLFPKVLTEVLCKNDFMHWV